MVIQIGVDSKNNNFLKFDKENDLIYFFDINRYYHERLDRGIDSF